MIHSIKAEVGGIQGVRMSYKYVEVKDIIGVRKVKWDGLWHIMYKWGSSETYDRVSYNEAMEALKLI